MSQSVAVAAQAQPAWFSRSKTRAPRFSIPLVARHRLLSDLDSALDKPLSCLVAPAGFGKSTLLTQWRETLLDRNIPCAWINLDENDREIRQFYAYLTFAFEDAGISLGTLNRLAENGFIDMSLTSIVTSLLTELSAIDEHMVLVLDDYHRAACEETDDFVKTLSDQFGDTIHVSIGSRKPVNVNLPMLLVSGRAIEIPSFDLRFSDSEVQEAMGADFDQEAVEALQQHVEGWPVAVQMMRLLDGTKGLGTALSARAPHPPGHLASYLVTNVLHSQPDELQQFLLETSILKRFNAEFANIVCGDDQSGLRIRQLDALQALVIPLDDDLEWLRYHHLFADCLSDLLKRQDPDRFVELHRRAAMWCGENRMVAEAVDYANAIEDYELSRQIINDNSRWIRTTYFGGAGYFNGLLANIPEKIVAKDPRLLYCKVYTCILNGNYKQALRYHDAAEMLMDRCEPTPESLRDRLSTGTGLLCRTEYKMARDGGWLKARLEFAEGLQLPSPEMDSRPTILCCLALQSLFYGEFEEASAYTLAAERDYGDVVALFCEINFGIIELWTNALDRSRRRFERTSLEAVRMSGDQSNLKFICNTFVAAIDYWQSGLDADPNDALERLVLRVVECDGGYEVYNVGFDAVVHDALSHRDYDRADFLIGKLEYSAERFAMQRLTQFAQQLRIDCAVGRGDLAGAARMFAKVQDWLDVEKNALDDLGWRHKVTAFYSCGRYLGAAGRYEEALAHIERGLGQLDPLDVVLVRARGNILKASLLEQMQRQDDAIHTLVRAIEDAARAGCARVFAADVSPDLVRKAARFIADGNGSAIAKGLAEQLSSSHLRELFTVREKEVLRGLANGKSNKEIARDLDLTDNTVKFHVRNIYRKLEVSKRVQAVEKAHSLGIVP